MTNKCKYTDSYLVELNLTRNENMANAVKEVEKRKSILIVEDDLDIIETLELFLTHNNYDVHTVTDGAEACAAAERLCPSLIIMDIMLPNVDGIQCTSNIRQNSNVPVLMLTAKVDRSSKLLGLEIGADDYVCKPFDIDELLLRIKVLLKRTEGNVYYGKWHIDEEKFTATVSAKTLAFSAIEFKLFSLLFKSPDRIFSREQIINLAYSEYHDITDRTIDSHVRNLRKKFKEADIEPSPIQSVYGAGYRFHKDPTIR